MRRFPPFALLAILITLPASASTLRVTVINAAGEAVSDAKVTWTAAKLPRGRTGPTSMFTFTLKNGRAEFTHVDPGEHSISVSKSGYLRVSVSGIPVEAAVPQRRGVNEIVVVLNEIELLDPFGEP